jgi:hypothetical protein
MDVLSDEGTYLNLKIRSLKFPLNSTATCREKIRDEIVQKSTNNPINVQYFHLNMFLVKLR